jgi:glycosyltransferase involved in cell wall biosynthesis
MAAHLLWLTENYFPSRGGMAQSCDRIVHNLRHLGVPVDLLHFTRHLHEPRIETKLGGRYIGYPLGDDPAHGLNCAWELIERERAPYTHLVAFGGVIPIMAGPLFAAWLGIPLVTLFRGNDFDTGVFSPKRADLIARAIERSRMVCVVSRDKERKIKALHPSIDVVWIPNGIDTSSWDAAPSDRRRAAAWRGENVEPERRVLGMIGQIKRKKGGPFFLQSLLDSGRADRFHLLFVGDLDEETVALLDAHAGALCYSLYPFGDRYDLLARYTACDMVAIPSFYDGLPNVLLEAASLGVPLVASTAGGMGDLLIDNRHGYLFHPGDAGGCRAAIARAAAASREELERMGKECRALVSEGYDHITEAERYRSALESILSPPVAMNGGTVVWNTLDNDMAERTSHS